MADRLWPTPVSRLARLLPDDQDCFLGLHKDLIFRPDRSDPFICRRFGRSLETPVGVAAGPHTQLAQNIVAAWLMGARFVELKTVQTLDQLEVTKPCIVAEDEGYNCEWSQELALEQSAEEYVKAWLLIHVLRQRLGWGIEGGLGLVFNMSVGYDLAGIRSANVQRFLDVMADAREVLERVVRELEPVFPEVRALAVPNRLSDNVTLSTMHGCPPQEIEDIARYLMEDRGLHTTIKLNPTLLGPREVRGILNDTLGYAVTVPDAAFEHDPEYDAAIRLVETLGLSAADAGVSFAVKLTNTLETTNTSGVLPANETMVYLSGRPLHVISVALAARLQRDFKGALDLSFSGGADCFNTPDLVACGLEPVTVCTDLLKPGGYARLPQYMEELRNRMKAAGATDITEWQRRYVGGSTAEPSVVCLDNLEQYSRKVRRSPDYTKTTHVFGQSIKTPRPLTSFDCVHAPCVETCPADQAVPDYMYHTSRGENQKAFDVITRANPFPTVTGLVCDHLCQFKCTRVAYDHPVQIRDVKRFVAETAGVAARAKGTGTETVAARAEGTGTGRVAVVGGGPSGMACAAFLAREGVNVEIYEAKDHLGGMLQDAIPGFRLTAADIGADTGAIESLGVLVHLGSPVDRPLFHRLCEDFDAVYVAVGAQRDRRLGIPGEDQAGIEGALGFLSHVGRGETVGPRVAVIGGGNSAVDAARVSYRLTGPDGEISLLYRRTLAEMPADHEELVAIEEEGILIEELVAPVSARRIGEGVELVCKRMRLGDDDSSGRPRPIPVKGSEHTRVFDTVLTAIGQVVDLDFAEGRSLTSAGDSAGTLLLGGDALRGPASIIVGVGDGRKAAQQILRVLGQTDGASSPVVTAKTIAVAEQQKKASRRVPPVAVRHLALDRRRSFERVIPVMSPEQARVEADRCLLCDEICNICVTVCPNRANLFYCVEPFTAMVERVESGRVTPIETMTIKQSIQTINIADWCNECGNCTSFCPTGGSPYRDKPRFCLTDQGYDNEDNAYRFLEKGVLAHRRSGIEETLSPNTDGWIYRSGRVRADLTHDGHIKRITGNDEPIASDEILEMIFLNTRLRSTALGRFLAGSTD